MKAVIRLARAEEAQTRLSAFLKKTKRNHSEPKGTHFRTFCGGGHHKD